MKSPLHHIKNPEWLFEYFHQKIHHAFVFFLLAIVGMLWGASNIFTPTSANRQWWGFITHDFWEQNPSTENIRYALFGDWMPWSTAYTRLRDSSCVPTNVVYLSTWNGWALLGDTIYVINSWTYTITTPIIIGSCATIIGKGDVSIKPVDASTTPLITIINNNHLIIDNIKVDGQSLWINWININNSDNITLNTMDFYRNDFGIRWINWSNKVYLSNSRLFNNQHWWYFDTSHVTVNNSLFFNNTTGLLFTSASWSINNSQIFNNAVGINAGLSTLTINNGIFFNNAVWIYGQTITGVLNTLSLYNNTTWLQMENSWYINYYGTIKFFTNDTNYFVSSSTILQAWSSPISSWGNGQIDTWSMTMSYDFLTNPQNGVWSWLLNSNNRTALRNTQIFDSTKQPIRYISGKSIFKQTKPVWYNWSSLEEFGSVGSDYFTTKYIAGPESTLSAAQEVLVDKYFGSWSLYTQNWETNWCSLSAFQVKTLPGGIFSSTYNFEDHTIYILTGDEYRSNVGWTSNGFVFNGNCIALIGTSDTRFTKSGWGGMNSILYADTKRNIIIDSIKVDALYFGGISTSTLAKSAIKFDGASNNSTIHNVQTYNAATYGIYLGLGSHHNTITNTQSFNNLIAGIHLYYSSNYNIINNTQTYNNNGYWIWFANGSQKNTINNFQSYNNTIWIFWDLTTKENIINRSVIYNNSDVGIDLKNSSGNILNDVRVYNNTIGIRVLYNSQGNKYYGELKLFDNTWWNFDGTLGNDSYLSAGTAWFFPYAGILTTWNNIFSCLYATNPILSGSSLALLNATCTNIWYTSSFQTSDTTYIYYTFGLDIYKQKIPVRYTTGNTLIQLPSQYDSNNYIAGTVAIRNTISGWIIFTSSGATQLNSWYTTNIYTAGMLTVAVPVSLFLTPISTSWSLIINWNAVGLTGTIISGNTIQVRLLTRAWYNETITGTVIIWSINTSFTITTKQSSFSGCSLSDTDRSIIKTIFDSLVEGYTGDTNKFDEFLYTMQSMLADEINFTNNCNLQYLQDLINWELGITRTGAIHTGIHIAPNCKEYPINFDFIKKTYTSPVFKVATHFANRDSLGRYIDAQNPGDCHINIYWPSSWAFSNTDPSRHNASNGKVYTIFSTNQWYSANEFIVRKYFGTISALRNYIDSKNPPQAVRSHQVDTTFTPQTYTAPNWKTYTIYRTDRWYMSYKLMKVRYFSTLSDIQSFINKNNPR